MSPQRTTRVARDEFELACVREFSHSGHQVSFGVSAPERRERIRVAILRENKTQERWQNSCFTYAEVFTQAYQQPLAALESHGKLAAHSNLVGKPPAAPDDIDEEEEEEGFDGDDEACA